MKQNDDKSSGIDFVNLVSLYKDTKPKYLLICSYTLSLSYLEKKFLLHLREKNDTKIAIITSDTGFHTTLDEANSLKGIGVEYSLFHFRDYPNAFHPKIFLSVDENNEFKLFVGGANFTYKGLSLNIDVIDLIESNQLNVVSKTNILSFLMGLKNDIKSQGLDDIISHITTIIEKQTPISSDIYFIHNFNRPIGDQIIETINAKTIKTKVISPYFDYNFSAFKLLNKNLKSNEIDLLFNFDDNHVNLSEIPPSTNVFTVNDEYNRYLHGKAYIFYEKTCAHLVVGSANCTMPGLWKKGGEGNWEAIIVRKNLDIDFCDKYWKGFAPEKLKKNDHWEYIKPNKNEPLLLSNLSFHCELENNQLTITPESGFSNKKTSVQFEIINNYNDRIIESHEIDDSSKSFSIWLNSDVIELIDQQPARLAILIDDGSKKGITWIIQTHVLRKVGLTRRLESTIRQFQYDNVDGWDAGIDLINFISNYYSLITTRQPNIQNTDAPKKKTIKSIPILGEIYTDDEQVYFGNYKLEIGGALDLGSKIKHLIEQGLQESIILDDDKLDLNDEDDEEPSPKNKNQTLNRNERESENILAEKKKMLYDAIINLRDIIDESIFKIFENKIKTISRIPDPNNLFEYFCNTICFSLKLARFYELEVQRRIGLLSEQAMRQNHISLQQFIVQKSYNILIEFKNRTAITKEEYYNIVTSTDLGSEIALFLCEIWNWGYFNTLSKNTFYNILEAIITAENKEHIKHTILNELSSSRRFTADRKNVLFNSTEFDVLYQQMTSSKSIQDIRIAQLEKHVKIEYWQKALQYHKNAIIMLQKDKDDNTELIKDHQDKITEYETIINELILNKHIEFDDALCQSIHLVNELVYIDELQNDLVEVRCKCNYKLDYGIIRKIIQCETTICANCKKPIIPVKKHISFNPVQYSNPFLYNRSR